MTEAPLVKNLILAETIGSFFQVATKPLSLINAFFIIKLLSVGEFGLYSLVLSIYALISGFTISFMDHLTLNEMGIFHSRQDHGSARKLYKEYFWLKTMIGLLLTIVVFSAAEVIGQRYGADIGAWVRIISFLFIVDNLRSMVIIFLQYKLHFFLSSFYDFAYETTKLILLLILSHYLSLSVTEILSLTVIVHLLIIPALLLPVVRDLWQFLRQPSDQKERMIFWRFVKQYGFWAIARNYLLNFSQNVRPGLIGYFLGAEAIGLFSVAISFLGALKNLISFNSLKIFMPREVENQERLEGLVKRGSRYFTYACFGLLIIGSTLIPLIIHYFLPDYRPAIVYFLILAMSVPLYGVTTVIGQILYTLRRQKELFLTPLGALVTTLVLTVLLAPTFGLKGVALEFVLAQVVTLLLYAYFLARVRPDLSPTVEDIFKWDSYDRTLLKQGWQTLKLKFRPTRR